MDNDLKRILLGLGACGWTNDPQETGRLGDNHMSMRQAIALKKMGYVVLEDTKKGYSRVYYTDDGLVQSLILGIRSND